MGATVLSSQHLLPFCLECCYRRNVTKADKRMRREVGKRATEFRTRLGRSIPEVAAAAKMDRTYLWRIERGDSFPPIPRLRHLAKVLRVDVSTLLFGEPG
jgi:ribosome-binding protein aMBF1 (putative translation factor)